MELWPAIDLLRGQAVRLHQGDYDKVTVYHADPAELAASWRGVANHLHVVDLEGARQGRPVEGDLVRRIVQAFGPGVEVGGGVRDRAAIESYLALGVDRVVLGTVAIRNQGLVREAANAHPRRVVLALDAKNGLVATDGWLSVSTRTSVEVVHELAHLPIAAVLYTDIARDGTRAGPNVEATARLAEQGGLPVLASGGIATLDDLRQLAQYPKIAGAIVGRALYEKAFTLEEAVRTVAALG
ncbi:MAG TPA: 1-(5-phosphoribosyl)-5-[(5-phosphoribosylamino)methylideneamino]imidazole-4-carboxamide isomerase [Polyangiaceae bacterium]|nr:1-(5-phosphoribosyl)-5-[(5-phosphoribosylamino)methylideneamino]imidazole-4-carboxamide isomerase [Polyangiaceae bacterium]